MKLYFHLLVIEEVYISKIEILKIAPVLPLLPGRVLHSANLQFCHVR